LRKRGKVFEAIEKFSVIKTLQAIEASNVVLLMIDAQHEVSDQDAHIAGFILETGRALVVAINKWDGLDSEQRERIQREFDRKLRFLSFARQHTISALRGQGVNAGVDFGFAQAEGRRRPFVQLGRVLADRAFAPGLDVEQHLLDGRANLGIVFLPDAGRASCFQGSDHSRCSLC
jgi:predicted membrane GTPase involved in stress response